MTYNCNLGTTPDRRYGVVIDNPIPNRQQNIFSFTQQQTEIVWDKSISQYVEMDAAGDLAPLCLTRDVASIRSSGDPNACIYPQNLITSSFNWNVVPQYSVAPYIVSGASIDGDPFFDMAVDITNPNGSFGFDVNAPLLQADLALAKFLKGYNYINLITFINNQNLSDVRISPAYATAVMQNNRGFAIRMASDSVTLSSPRIYALIGFGAPIGFNNDIPYGGQYVLALRGDGSGTLYAFNQKSNTAPIDGAIGLGDFRWCKNGQSMNTHHYLEVSFNKIGRKSYIYILSEQADVNYKKGFPNTNAWSGDSQNRPDSKSLSKIPLLSYGDVYGQQYVSTVFPYDVGPGPVVVMVQDDTRVLSQILNLVYASNNLVATGVISVPFADFNLRPQVFGPPAPPEIFAYYYSRSAGALKLNNPAVNIQASSSTGQPYKLSYDSSNNQIVILVGNPQDIGFKMGYVLPTTVNPDGSGDYESLVRIGAQYTNQLENSPPPSIATDDKGWFMVGADFSTMPEEAQSESGTLHLQDLQGLHTRLHTRGFFPVVIYSTSDMGPESIVFQGYLTNMQNLHRTSVNPCYNGTWREYNGTLVGEWYRLNNTKVPFGRITMTPDPSQLGSGNDMIGYKITDMVRTALGWAGYSSDEIDVPDDPIRFTASSEQDINDQIVQPLQPILQFVTNLLKNWLGWFLYFDANASKGITRGMWRVFAPPNPVTFHALAIFSTFTPTRFVTSGPSQYNSNVILPLAPIVNVNGHSSYTSYTSPPEGNALCLITLGGQATDSSPDSRFHILNWVYNFESFNFSPTQNTANIDSPDYLPYRSDIVIVDPQLGSQQAVDLLLRRYSDFVLHAQKFVSFIAPLVLVIDPMDQYQIAPRPLKFYDAVELRLDGIVTIGLIKSVKIHLEGKSNNTLATYEILIPNVNVGMTGGLGGNNGS